MPAPKELTDLIAHYHAKRDELRDSAFKETQARIELIDPLFNRSYAPRGV